MLQPAKVATPADCGQRGWRWCTSSVAPAGVVIVNVTPLASVSDGVAVDVLHLDDGLGGEGRRLRSRRSVRRERELRRAGGRDAQAVAGRRGERAVGRVQRVAAGQVDLATGEGRDAGDGRERGRVGARDDCAGRRGDRQRHRAGVADDRVAAEVLDLTTGCVANATPLVAPLGCVVKASCAAGPTVIVVLVLTAAASAPSVAVNV